jgi:hypothetical protein
MTESRLMLNLRPACIAAPSRMDVAVIEVAMLWPKDGARRDRALRAAFAQNMIDTDYLPETVTRDDMRTLMGAIRDAPRIDEIQTDGAAAFKRGARVGSILREAVGLNAAAPHEKISLKKIKQRFSAPLPGEKDRGGAALQKDWDDYRSVASLWAAFLHLRDLLPDEPFPCASPSIIEFLATAAAFQTRGESIHLKQSKEVLLPKSSSVAIPAWLDLPTVQLHFQI